MSKPSITSKQLFAAAACASASMLWAPHAAGEGKIQPGQWRTTETVLEMSNPMMSPELIARRKTKPAVAEYCVRSDDLQELLVGKDKAGLCQGDIKIGSGRIAISRTCTTGLGKGSRKIDGSYTPVRIETMRETQQETPQGMASSKLRVVSERLGECTS